MITITHNNFGKSETIQLQDYQSESLCILCGTFTIDPANLYYQAASQIELALPSSFAMKRSAVSTAILISSIPGSHRGTVLRCHIENYTLIIEKLTHWDEHGPLTIVLASAFVTRGYRGEYHQLPTTALHFENGLEAERQYCVVTDDYCALSIIFKNLLGSTFSDGPISVALNGFPTDIDLTIPLSVQGSSYEQGTKGSSFALAHIQNAHLHLEYDPSSLNLGANSFSCFFAIRGTYTPIPAIEGDFCVSLNQLTPKTGVTIDDFQLLSHNSISMLSINSTLQRNTDTIPFTIYLDSVPDYAPYNTIAPVIVRADESNNYAISYNKLCWSRHFSAFTLDTLQLKSYRNITLSATTLYEYVHW